MLLFSVFLGLAAAHEIPNDLTGHVFVKPEGTRLTVLVRVPLKAVRDVNFPERANGYLDVSKLAPQLPDLAKIWIGDFCEIYEGEARLPQPRIAGVQISLESDRSFEQFALARAHIGAALPSPEENLVWSQVFFDVALEFPIRSDRARFSIQPGLHRLAVRTQTVVRYLPPGGGVRALQFEGDAGLVPLDPSWTQAFRRFFELGVRHILEGTDHLLFVACLVIPFRRLGPLAGIVTAFTAAHSLTLIASAYDFSPDALWFPPLVETLIAASIVYMALENIVATGAVRRRWLIAFGFGLVHGFGFSFALRETLQFGGSHLLASLISFNLGVELGQLVVLAMLVPVLDFLFHRVVAERMGVILVSAFLAHTGYHWMLDRGEALLKFDFQRPVFDLPMLVAALRVTMVLLIAGGLLGLIASRYRRHNSHASANKNPENAFHS